MSGQTCRRRGTERKRQFLVLFAAGLCLIALGCSKGEPKTDLTPREPDFYGNLSALKAINNPDIQDELTRIAEEKGLPRDLTDREPPRREENIAAGIKGLFPAVATAQRICREADEALPENTFDFHPDELQQMVRMMDDFQHQLQMGRDALRRGKCDWEIPYNEGRLGDAKMDVLDKIWAYAYLEIIVAAISLREKNEIDPALDSAGFLMRLAAHVGNEPHSIMRLEAAALRTWALKILLAAADHQKLEKRQLKKMHQMVEAHLKAWPDEKRTWTGRRAIDLHSYEMIRQGDLLSLLDDAQTKEFKEKGTLEELPVKLNEHLETDLLNYLKKMRLLIKECEKPYYERREFFEKLAKEMKQDPSDAGYAFIATQILGFTDIPKHQATLAEDRANWEALLLGLAYSLGEEPPDYKINPLSGKEYKIRNAHSPVTVEGIAPAINGQFPRFEIPILPPDPRL